MALAGLALLIAAACSVFLSSTHNAHAYDATLWVIAGFIVFHAAIVGIMTVFLGCRVHAGFISPRRIGEVRVVMLWVDFTALIAAVGLIAAWLPGVIT